jgi:hypothetical protein
MGTVRNVGVSGKLLAAMDAAAKEQGKTADDLFEEAGRRLLAHNGPSERSAAGGRCFV